MFYSKLEYDQKKTDNDKDEYIMSSKKLITLETNIIAAEFVKLTC